MVFGEFVRLYNMFVDLDVMDDRNAFDPCTCCDFQGGNTTYLSTIAVSQVVSSSLVQRNCSTYGFIHLVK
jgi:hypothetical protein